MLRPWLPIAAIAIALPVAASAQFSESFNFLKAVRDGDGTKVTEALRKPGNVLVNTRDLTSGEAALHIVTKRRDTAYLGFLLSNGANPNLPDGQGQTALLLAAQLGWVDGAQILLARRASVDFSNARGETPLIVAVQNRDIAMVRMLLAAGANANKPDNGAGLSARDYATRDARSSAILKEIQEAKPVVRRPVAGPR